MAARAIMLQGTGSDVGKTVLVAGLCRWARRRGLDVRPFKPQNMSNNAAVAELPLADGGFGEIGRAQQLQAQACGVPSSTDMNPVLLKPQSESGSQVVVNGRVLGSAKGRDYQRMKPRLLGAVLDAFERLRASCDLVIVEGAGSPAEINLRAGDIANMGFATRAEVPVVLVGDIDRGGVIASLVGTHAILEHDDRNAIQAFLINKFRGDVSLFDDGLEAVTRFTSWPSLGVVPWLPEASRLPAEDSVALDRVQAKGRGRVKVVVPVLPRIANFDDLDPLMAEPDVEVVLLRDGPWPENAALVVLPGSKATIADLEALRARGWDEPIRAHAERGGHVVGICGGYQMLGRRVADPDGIEGPPGAVDGLGLLDVETTLVPAKMLRNVSARECGTDLPTLGYEIHMGVTTGPGTRRPWLVLEDRPDGAVSSGGNVRGAYLHGLFAGDAFRAGVLEAVGATSAGLAFDDGVDRALDDLADRLAMHVDPAIFDLTWEAT